MSEEIKIYFDEDGIAKEYDDTYDITIHCESEEEQNELLDRLNRQWIPVSERLPEERDWYLVVFKEKDTGYQLIPRVADYIGKGENKWRLIDEDGLVSEYRDLLECVAWMPLPLPYKASPTDKEVEE